MTFDVDAILKGLGLLGGVVGTGVFTNWLTGKFKRDESQIAANTQLAQMNITAESEFQKMVLAELKETKLELKSTNEKLNLQALEVAELRGEVRVLKSAESHLKLENTRLITENTHLKQKVEMLDDENELQGQKISELTGKLSVFEQKAQP